MTQLLTQTITFLLVVARQKLTIGVNESGTRGEVHLSSRLAPQEESLPVTVTTIRK